MQDLRSLQALVITDKVIARQTVLYHTILDCVAKCASKTLEIQVHVITMV